MINRTSCFIREESGATATEYGLIAAGIAVSLIMAAEILAMGLGWIFENVAASF